MSYNFKNHPTRYKQTLFRSRLEARWAAFFDIMMWKWEYEPIDLDGWTPDFRVFASFSPLTERKRMTFLVEVKPFIDPTEFPLDKMVAAAPDQPLMLCTSDGKAFIYAPKMTNKTDFKDTKSYVQLLPTEEESGFGSNEWTVAGNWTRYQAPKEGGR